MDIYKLLRDTSNNINNEVSLKNRSKQSIICSYLSDIETLNAHGISYRIILEHGDIPIALKHFHDLIYRAKKKRTYTSQTIKSACISSEITAPKGVKPKQINRTDSKQNPSIDLLEWKLVMADISENLVHQIVASGYTLQDVRAWIGEQHIPNSSALRRYFNAYKSN